MPACAASAARACGGGAASTTRIGRAAGDALIAAGPGRPARPRHPAGGGEDGSERGRGDAGPVPCADPAVAERDRGERRHEPVERAGHRRGGAPAAGGVGGADLEEQLDERDLRRRRAVGDAAVGADGRGERGGEQRLGARQPGVDAGNEQRGDVEPGGGGDAQLAVGQFVDRAVEVPRHPRQRVEHGRAIDEVGRRQDVRRVGRPEDQPLGDQVGGPGDRVEVGVIGEPARDDRLGDRRAARAVGHRGEVAQPGEAVRPVPPRRRRARVGEAQGARRVIPGVRQPPGDDPRPDRGVAGQWVGGDGEQLQREMAAQPDAVERGAVAQPVEAGGDALGEADALVAAARGAPRGRGRRRGSRRAA